MENMAMGSFADGEWESLCKMFTFEEPDFVAQFLVTPLSNDNSSSYNPPNAFLSLNNDVNCSSQDSSSTPSYDFPFHVPSYENQYLTNDDSHLLALVNDTFLSTNFSAILDVANQATIADNADGSSSSYQTGVSEDSQSSHLGYSPISMDDQLKRKHIPVPEMKPETELQSGSTAVSKKKARTSNNIKAKNSVQLKQIESSSEEDTMTVGSNDQSASGSGEISNDGSNASEEASKGEYLTSKGKKRASRGAATDPQSLYARRRRERINERLRILQNLVPNGSKVDISTMLEEAVHYVKFMQLQIKLLSSDELWMYAPVAYNGVDINLYRRISPFLLP